MLMWPILMTAVLGLGPLSEGRRVQLDTAQDGWRPDEPALYALLPEVMTWQPEELQGGLIPGVTIPDFDAMLAEPAAVRGDLFLVEGQFARQRRVDLVRPGPWGEAITEWGLIAEDGRAIVLYLVDPEGTVQPPPARAKVRAVARFYKLWDDRDAAGDAASFPVFVGRAAELVRPETNGSGIGPAAAIIAGVVALLLALIWVRRLSKNTGSRREQVLDRLRRNAERYDDNDEQEADGPPLPDDPELALQELERRRDEV
jgi:hypothetical protein